MFRRKNSQLDNILDDCLERLLVKGESIEECLADYPEQADELKPLLQTAVVTRKALDIEPRPEFRARARYQLHAALKEAAYKQSRPFFARQFRWATVVSATLILLLAGGGIVAAASNSMPDEPLYQVKLATEQIQLYLTFSPLDKAELYAKLADRRVTEIIDMAQEGNVRLVELTTQRLDNHLSMIASSSTVQRAESTLAGEALTTITTTETVTTTVAGAGAPPEGTVATITTTVTKTVGGDILPEGISELSILTTTKTVTTTVAGAGAHPEWSIDTVTKTVTKTVSGAGETTLTPAPTVEVEIPDTTTVPKVTTVPPDEGFSDYSQQAESADGNLANQIRQQSASNIAALYDALESAPEEVKPALMQAIAVLEAGYENALNAIGE
jgi:hypothetical protein